MSPELAGEKRAKELYVKTLHMSRMPSDGDSLLSRVTGLGVLKMLYYNEIVSPGIRRWRPCHRAWLDYPKNIALGAAGNLYIADQRNHRIRKVAHASAGTSGNGEILFPDENGTGHVMSAAGRHERTADLDTGITLRRLGRRNIINEKSRQ